MNTTRNGIPITILATLLLIVACGDSSSSGDNRSITSSYRPVSADDGWLVSTPEAQGVDQADLDAAYREARQLSNIFSLLVVSNGYLIAERYFNGARSDDAFDAASVTKSYTSALTGIALREGNLTSVDQRMVAFFPEIDWQMQDPRKSLITIREMLQMRSGYPWEEYDGYMDRLMSTSERIDLAVEFPLVADPGSRFGYSNLTAHLVGVILARAAGESLSSFGSRTLFDPLRITVASWPTDADGYNFGSGSTRFTARDLARFGLLYLNGGVWEGAQLVPAEWIADSFVSYSDTTYNSDILNSITHLQYGYFWWSGTAGPHRFNFAWGHGGQMICVLQNLDMVIVATADGLAGQFDEQGWRKESAVMEVVGRLIASL